MAQINFRDPRITAWLIVTALAVSFFLYKGFSALTMKQSNVNDTPAPAFIQPGQAHITQRVHVFQARLPTDLEVLVYHASAQLGKAALAGSLGSGELTRDGMSGKAARQTLRGIGAALSAAPDRTARFTGSWTLTAVNGSSAVLRAPFSLYDAGGAPPIAGSVIVQWQERSGWRGASLSSLRIQLVPQSG